jgi:hypothetical protein
MIFTGAAAPAQAVITVQQATTQQARSGAEIRNPKAEGRKKPEIRSPKSEAGAHTEATERRLSALLLK